MTARIGVCAVIRSNTVTPFQKAFSQVSLLLDWSPFENGGNHFQLRVFSLWEVHSLQYGALTFVLRCSFTSIQPFWPRETKRCLRACEKCTDSDHPTHTQSVIRAFALHSYILLYLMILLRTVKALLRLCRCLLGLCCLYMPKDTFCMTLASVGQLDPTGTRSRVRPLLRSATFFCRDWSWNIFYGHSLPSADSRRVVVSFCQKNVHNTG